MDQFIKEEDHKFTGQNTQQLDFTKLLQDVEAFENVFFPPSFMDYNPMNINEYIDFNELQQFLNEGSSAEGKEGGVNGGHGNNGDLMDAKLNVEENVNKRVRRNRFKKGSVEAARMRELHRIRNRESASRSFAKAKAYIQELEVEVQKFRKKNANLKKLILFLESSPSLGMTQKQLERSASGPM